jgi:hypothetical protein
VSSVSIRHYYHHQKRWSVVLLSALLSSHFFSEEEMILSWLSRPIAAFISYEMGVKWVLVRILFLHFTHHLPWGAEERLASTTSLYCTVEVKLEQDRSGLFHCRDYWKICADRGWIPALIRISMIWPTRIWVLSYCSGDQGFQMLFLIPCLLSLRLMMVIVSIESTSNVVNLHRRLGCRVQINFVAIMASSPKML